MERGRAEGRQCAFSPAGTCHVSMCLTPESGDVSKKQTHTNTHTRTQRCHLPNFTHSEDWGINSMMKPNTTSAALSAGSWRNSPSQCTHAAHKHTHANTDTHSQATSCTDKQIIIPIDQRRHTLCFAA